MELAIVFAVNVVSSLLKKYVQPRFGKLGVQALVFATAVAITVYLTYGASVQTYVEQSLIIFVSSVALYEVILSRITWFKKN